MIQAFGELLIDSMACAERFTGAGKMGASTASSFFVWRSSTVWMAIFVITDCGMKAGKNLASGSGIPALRWGMRNR